tara:strand:- start:1917 stop:3044 length:1128 start_codon:yes stop_codon:yes gene_type:complete
MTNWSNAKVQSRLHNAIGFVSAHLGTTTPRQLSTRLITQEVGQKQLGNTLRELLITNTDKHYSMESGLCKKYILNYQGVAKATSSLVDHSLLMHCSNKSTTNNSNKEHYSNPSVVLEDTITRFGVDWTVKKYKEELDTFTFNYDFNHNDNRFHHGLQNIKKKVRTKALASAGLIHDYDIDSTLPTMILYHNKELGGELYSTIKDLIENKQLHREYLAQALEIDIKTAKQIFTAIFNGAKNLAPNSYSQIYQMLGGDDNIDAKAKLECLKQDYLYINLKDEIKQCWDVILPHYEHMRLYKDNGNKKRFTGREKWHIYSLLEYKAAVLIQSYLNSNNHNYFWIHDGWTSDRKINKSDLEQHLRKHTDMQLSITYNEE